MGKDRGTYAHTKLIVYASSWIICHSLPLSSYNLSFLYYLYTEKM